MAARQYRADVTQSLLVISSEDIASSTDSFSSSGTYIPDFKLLDAKNVLPTVTGYTSYFGTDVDFEDPLTVKVQDIISIRTTKGDTLLVALCQDGLRIKSILGTATPTVVYTPDTPDPNADNLREQHLLGWTDVTMPEGKCSWTLVAESELGSPNPWALWTWAIVNNKIYFYQQGLGHILHIYGYEKGIIRIDQLEPYYIIGTIEQYRWTISATDSNNACSDTTKSFEIPGLGTFSVYNLDKAHFVKNVISQWEYSLLGLLGIGATITPSSITHTPLSGEILFELIESDCEPKFDLTSGAFVDTSGPVLMDKLVTYTNGGWEIEYTGNYALCGPEDLNYEVASGQLTLRPEYVYTCPAELGYPESITATYIPAETAFVEVSYVFTYDPVVGNPAELESLKATLSAGGTFDNISYVLAPKDPATPGSRSGKVVYPAVLTEGGFSAIAETTAWYDAGTEHYQNSTLTISDVTVTPNYTLTGYLAFPFLDFYAETNTGSNGNWQWDIVFWEAVDVYFAKNNMPQIHLGAYVGSTQGGAPLRSNKLYIQAPPTEVLNIACFVTAITEQEVPSDAIYYDNMSCGYYVGPTVPSDLGSNTPGAVTLANLTSSDTITYGELLYAGDLVFAIPPGEYLTFWVDISNSDGASTCPGLTIMRIHDPVALANCEASGEGTIPLLSLSSDGAPSELTSSWDTATDTLAVESFKEFSLTSITINNAGVPVRTFGVSSLEDSNDLWTKLISELGAAFPGLTITPTLLQSAEADAAYSIAISYVDFDQATPVPVLDHDGDCTWSLSSTETTDLALAQVSGITSARGRLVAWDRENALYTSSNQDPLDFTPDIATQANVGKAQAVQGDIILCLGWNDGFIIYSTNNIVRAKYTGGTYVFDYNAIADQGAIDVRHITGNFDSQFAWTNKGLVAVDTIQGQVQEITPEIVDWLAQHPYPIKTSYVGDRYLILSILARPPGVYAPIVRQGTDTSAYRKGTGIYAQRSTTLATLTTFPFGSNLFPTYQLALVYDTILSKWGIAVLPFKTLFSLNPVNAKGFPAEKSPNYNEPQLHNLIRSLGGVLEDSSTVIFNDSPADAYLCFGHSKFDVQNWSRLIKVEAEYVDYANAAIHVEPSYDGRTIEWDSRYLGAASTAPFDIAYIDIPALWYNILIRGTTFNLRSFTIEGYPHGRL